MSSTQPMNKTNFCEFLKVLMSLRDISIEFNLGNVGENLDDVIGETLGIYEHIYDEELDLDEVKKTKITMDVQHAE